MPAAAGAGAAGILGWPSRRDRGGIGGAGKFERYFAPFRRLILPLVHRRARVEALLVPRDRPARQRFYSDEWDTWRWRLLFRLFFSRTMMGRLGRDPEFFRYVDGDVGPRILDRTAACADRARSVGESLRALDPDRHARRGAAVRVARSSFARIRANLDRLEWRQASIEDFCGATGATFDRFNLSDLFEYVSARPLPSPARRLVRQPPPHARLAYWNMLAPATARRRWPTA